MNSSMNKKIQKTNDETRKENEYNNFMSTIEEMLGFYRENPHRFVKDYLNIILKDFQQVILNEMFINDHIIYVAARGQGKSFLLAVFCVAYCLLYPGTTIVIVSKTKEQAIEIIGKIVNELSKKNGWGSLNLIKEIKFSSEAINNAKVEFKNTSLIRIAPSSENARHLRANVIINDEYRMIPHDIIKTVIKRFLSSRRTPGFFKKNSKLKKFVEPNKEIYASSAWMKDHWSYQLAKSYVKNMVRGRSYFICDLPYQVSVRTEISDKTQIEDEMTESTFDQLAFDMEMKGIWQGNKDGAFFKYTEINKRRLVNKYLPSFSKLMDEGIKIPICTGNMRRILSVDVALMASTSKSQNDLSVLIVNEAIPTISNYYNANIVFIEGHEGLTTDELGLMVMRYFYNYNCTDVVIDTNSVGLGVYDFIIRDQYDKLTGLTYPAITCCNNDEMAKRCKVEGAKSCVWSIKAYDTLNNEISVLVRNYFQNGRINLLVNEYEGEDYLKESIKNYSKLTSKDQLYLKMPYHETNLLVNEMVNLLSEVRNSKIKLTERSGMRKDRYSSLGYNCYIMSQIEQSLKPKRKNDNNVIMATRKPKYNW